MELGFSGEGFANLLTISGLIGAALAFIIGIIAASRGIDIDSSKFQFKLIGTLAFIFIIVPLLLSDLNFRLKLGIIVLSISAGIINFLVVLKIIRDREKKT